MDLINLISQFDALSSTLGILGVLTLIQVTPIKINPWSSLAAFIGRNLNKEIVEEIDGIKADVKSIDKKVSHLDDRMDENTAVEARIRILRFADEVSHSQPHSRNHFQQVMQDITSYKRYCEEHPEFKNDMTKIDSERIEEDYKMRDATNSFL